MEAPKRLAAFTARATGADADGEESIRSVLLEALHARKRDGTTDYPTRLRAAQLLLGAEPERGGDQPRPAVITVKIENGDALSNLSQTRILTVRSRHEMAEGADQRTAAVPRLAYSPPRRRRHSA